jgi:hypothetical protein
VGTISISIFSSLFTVGEGTGTVENVDSLADLLRLGETTPHSGDQAMEETVSGLGLETAPHTGGQAMETVSGLGLEFVREFQL